MAPSGKLRIGINYGNAVLASSECVTGELRGVAVDLARELGRRCELPVELVAFESAGKMAAGVESRRMGYGFSRGGAGTGRTRLLSLRLIC